MKRVVLIRSNQVDPDPPVEKMASVLAESGHEIVILGWDRENNYYIKEEMLSLQKTTVPIVRFGIKAQFGGGIKKTSKQMFLFQKRIYKWLKHNKNNYDIIHSFDFDTGFVSSCIARRYKKKLVYHILDYYVESHGLNTKLGYIVEKSERYIINHADATIICTEKRKAQIAASRPKKLTVIHNSPMQTSECEVPFRVQGNNEHCKIVYVGILAGNRFIEEIIELVKEDERLEFHIGGFGKLEEKVTNEAKKCERIYFYGRLPYEKTLALERACDIMAAIYDPMIPNHRYAAPNKFYESLMLGKPIVMAKNTGFDEIIESNGIGITIPYTLTGLKEGINNLLLKQPYWNEMHIKSVSLYKKNYSWDAMKDRILKLYNNI